MQYKMDFRRRSEEEYIKDNGMFIDYDEIARKGKMSKEEALISKWYGVYQSRQAGDHMARIVVPGGKVNTAQARVVAAASRKYSYGLISMTTRQALQLHFLQLGILPDFMRELATVGLTTFHGCGDVTRPIAACPLAETCKYKRFNVLPYAQEAMREINKMRDLDNLPRKYKISFSGCSANCAQPYMQCNGIIAVTKNENGIQKDGFKFVIGGGMGWKAYVAKELFSFVPKEKYLDIIRAIALLYKEHGDRFNRTTSRLKVVVDAYGIDKCREIVLDFLKQEGKSVEGLEWESVDYIGTDVPKRPLIEEDPVGTDGLVTVRAIIPKGEIHADNLDALAEIAEKYGNQNLYTDNRQNLSIHGVEPKNIEKVKNAIHELGFRTEGFFGIRDIVSCVGTTHCPKAVSGTRNLFDALLKITQESKYDSIQKQGFINITGCPNSCSPYRIADIGFRGMRIRAEEEGAVEGYEMLIGGNEEAHGKKVGDFKSEDIPNIVRDLLDLFLAENIDKETIREFIDRKGVDYVKSKLLYEEIK